MFSTAAQPLPKLRSARNGGEKWEKQNRKKAMRRWAGEAEYLSDLNARPLIGEPCRLNLSTNEAKRRFNPAVTFNPMGP
jgi:hypothetical protein